jgi:ABC-type antimicrobial peptide transport system permease subunit
VGELLRRIHYLLHRRRLDAELENDMEFHREMAARQGCNNFGNMLRLREQAQEAWGWSWLDRFLQDMRWSWRGIKRAPGSALVMVLLLALGMGGVMALFGPLYSLVLKPLPFTHPERLVRIDGGVFRIDVYALHTYFNNRRSYDPIFSDLMGYNVGTDTLSGNGPTEQIDTATVTQEFFSTLGVQPKLGAGFPVDRKVNYYYDSSDISKVVVSDQLWRTRLHSTHDLSNAFITLDGGRSAVVGVMPPEFDFPSGVQVWRVGQLGGNFTQVGRMNPGLSMTQAQAGLRTLDSSSKDNHTSNHTSDVTVEPLHDYLLGDRKPLLWILSAVSILFLALACAGVANLLLARGVRRRPEMVVRAVLGAERGRLIRQLLTETLLLAAAGGLLGLGFAALARYGLQLLVPEMMKDAAGFSPATIALVALLTLAVTVLCGAAPAFHATGADLNSSLKAGNSASSTFMVRRHRFSTHEFFAGGQLVLAMVLLISTGLLLHSMKAKLDYPLGFDPNNIAVVRAVYPYPANLRAANEKYWKQHNYRSPRTHAAEEDMQKATEPTNEAMIAVQEQFYQEATRRLKEVQGVVSVAVINIPPFTKGVFDFRMGLGQFDSSPRDYARSQDIVAWGFKRSVSIGAFPLLGMHILAGRDFLPSDIPTLDDWKVWLYHENDNTPRRTQAVIVNEAFARHVWPNQNPIGKTFKNYFPVKVVGVVADIHESREIPTIVPTRYEPYTASTTLAAGPVTFLVKMRRGTRLSDLKKALPPGDADAAPQTVLPLQESLGNLRIALALLSCFSVLGIVVAGLGVYATATLMSASRTRETGIRLAIGASAEQVGWLTLWRSLRLALLGLPVGALGAWLLGRNLSHWLFQVSASDPLSYLTSAAVLLVIALVASLWPALRAATTDPSTALRYDG